jgi:hypothetical protein
MFSASQYRTWVGGETEAADRAQKKQEDEH